jgi:hypothetical protein
MTPHNHSGFVPGCYRCELSRDEARRQELEDAADDHYTRKWEDERDSRFDR